MQALLSGIRPYLALTLLWAVVTLPGLATLPVMDRDEARYLQATRQMAESGDYVVVRFQDELRAKKPVGIYWLQAAAVDLLSHPAKVDPLPYRLPSALAALVASLMLFRVGAALFDRRIALVAGALLGGSLMLAVEGHLGKTDAVLLAFTTIVQGTLALVYLQARGGPRAPAWAPLAFWLAMGCAILVKGPVTPAITLLTIAGLAIADRRLGYLQALRPVMGLIVCAGVVLPWLVAVNQATDGAFLARAVGEDLLPKLIGGQESHGAPPGYYALLVAATFWPGSLFLLPALARSWRERALPGLRFALAWAGPAWLMFELVPTKLPHYTLPLYPALALMVACALFAVRDGTYERLADWRNRLWYGLWTLVGLALAAAAVALPLTHGAGFSPWSVPAAVGGLAAGALAWVALLRRHYLPALGGGLAAAVVVYGAVFGGLLRDLDALWVSERLSAAADAQAPGAPLAAAGYSEPSLVFLTGTGTLLTGGAGAAAFLATTPGGVAAVEARERAAFDAALLADHPGLTVREVAAVEGFNYSRGKPVDVRLLVAEPR